MRKTLLCSCCFSDFGLQTEAARIGTKSETECQNCHLRHGIKLTRADLETLSLDFFVTGSKVRGIYGAAQRIEFNSLQSPGQHLYITDNLHADARLIEKTIGIAFFLYGPNLWMLGENTPLKNLHEADRISKKTIAKILTEFPKQRLTPGDHFFRIRTNMENPTTVLQYDAAPEGQSRARLNCDGSRVLYASQDLELCIHECRVTISDEIYVATLTPTRELTLLDLTGSVSEDKTPFESLNVAIHFLFQAEDQAYEACTKIAKEASARFDGIIFPSYFSQVKQGTIPNIALFGAPIEKESVQVVCINRLLLRKAWYEFGFGPAMFIDPAESQERAERMLAEIEGQLEENKEIDINPNKFL